MADESSTYPGSLDSFTDKEAKRDKVSKAHINKIQNAIEAIETELGTDPAGSKTDLKTRLAVMMADNGAIAQGTSFPGSPVEGQAFYRTDENTFYIYDGSDWVGQAAHGLQIFTSNDTFTAPGGITKVFVTLIGGGGGGAGGGLSEAGGGGAGGELLLKAPYTVTPGGTYSVVVGSGGAGGESGAGLGNGAAGGDSTFDGTLTADGGPGGTGSGATSPGGASDLDGADGSGNDGGAAGVQAGIKGGDGGDPGHDSGGGGGGSHWGDGGAGGDYNGNGANATGYGAGGGGGPKHGTGEGEGGDGSPGFVLVEW